MPSQKELEKLHPTNIQQISPAGFSSSAKILKTLNPAPVVPLIANKANLPQDVMQAFADTDHVPQYTGITNQTGLFGSTNAGRLTTGNASADTQARIEAKYTPGISSDGTPFADPLGTPPQARADGGERVLGPAEKNQKERDMLQEQNNVKQNNMHWLFAKPKGLNNKAILAEEAARKRFQIEKANELQDEQRSDNYGVQSPHRAPQQGR